MNVLVACEESQRVCIAFRERGHNAFSCDIQEPSGGHPEWHIHGDCLPVLRGGQIVTMDGVTHDIPKWDIIIAHPPCTYLTNTGNRWFNVERYGDKAIQRAKDREKAVEFFMQFVNADCDRIAIENPIGHMSTRYRKADQIIQPYEYGYPARKATCLWLKGLPKLKPTEIVEYKLKTRNYSDGLAAAWATDENGKILRWNDPETAKQRSKTVPGIAKAMAEQWG
jgi:hypothetical protein